jgi:hypothetical protein
VFLKCSTLRKSISFAFAPYFSICFSWLCLCPHGYTQTTGISEERKADKIKFDETDIPVKAEDIEQARINEEEIKTRVSKSIEEIKSLIAHLEQDAKTTGIYLDKLRQEKKDYQGRDVNPKFLELLDREIEVVKEKIDIDHEQIETYEDRITVLHDQLKVYAGLVVLLESIIKLEDSISTIPYDEAPAIRKEADVAKSYIIEIQDSIKEKEAVVSFFTNRVNEIKDKARIDEQNLARYLKSMKEGIGDEKPAGKLQEKIDSILRWKKTVNEQRITIFQTRLETSRIRYDVGLQAWKNAELNAAFLAEKARRLEERQKERRFKK